MMKQKSWLISIGCCAMMVVGIIKADKPHVVSSDRVPDRMEVDTVTLPDLSFRIGALRDSILYGSQLNDFFVQLDSLREGKDTVISVVHLGDSHIQAGFFSGQTMRLLQQTFGNAGRGWIAPFKLSRTNEPDDYFISSSVKEWVAGRSIQADKKCPVGLGGIGIQSVSPSINLDIFIAPNNGAGYAFNQAVLYRGDRSMPMLPAGAGKDSVHTFLSDTPIVSGLMADTFRLSTLVDTLHLHSTRRKAGTDSLLSASSFKNIYYGFNLTNGNPGVLYHSIGVNGAMYVNYIDEEYVKQLAIMKPALLIISMGTNETFGRHFQSNEFTGQIRDLITLVRKYMPEVNIMLTTPPECYKRTYVKRKRTYVFNSNTQQAAKAIRNVAREEGLACWDLFAAAGGKNSAGRWYKAGLFGRDRVHFTKEGYREQGTMFYRALMQSYNQYKQGQDVQ